MRRRILVLLAALIIAMVVFFVWPDSMPPVRPVSFIFEDAANSDAMASVIRVTVTNISNCDVLYAGGFGKAMLRIRHLSNMEWREELVRPPGVGVAVLLPGEAFKQQIEIPHLAERIQIGLDVTSLSWQGKLALRIARISDAGAMRPLVQMLLRHDDKLRRSKEWSKEVILVQSAQLHDN